MENNPVYKNYTVDQFTVQDLERIEPVDIEEYQEYLKVYKNPEEKQITNAEKGLSRKMSALRSFYGYFFKRQVISRNPSLLVDMPKLHDKAIIRLDTDEVAMLLDYIEHGGSEFTGQRRRYYEKTKNRDFAIIILLLGTGIRVSECVGLDIQDVDFKNNGIKVVRKGGNEMVVYFGEEVEEALKMYLYTTRKAVTPLPGHENALFLSTQRRRIGVQAVENMVKKYAGRSPRIRKLRLISCAVPTARPCTRKPGISIWWRMYSGTRMLIPQRSIMPQLMKIAAGRPQAR